MLEIPQIPEGKNMNSFPGTPGCSSRAGLLLLSAAVAVAAAAAAAAVAAAPVAFSGGQDTEMT